MLLRECLDISIFMSHQFSIIKNIKITNIYETLYSVNKPFLSRKLIFIASYSSSAARTKEAGHTFVCDRVYFSTEFNEIFLLVFIASHSSPFPCASK